MERGITDEEIEQTLENPNYTILHEGRKVAVKHFKERTLKVIYIEEEKYIKIITVY